MLFRKQIVSTRTFLQLAVAVIFSIATVGAASAANSGIDPLLVPYTINTVAGTPQFTPGTTAHPVGYFGEGVLAAPTLANPTGAAVMDGPFAAAVDSVGNVYITDSGNYIIREVNAQTGLINTIAGVVPKGCSGVTCTVRTSGCADGVQAAGSPIGNKVYGIAVDAYGNVYFDDNSTASVSVIYRAGTRVANFISLVDPGGVANSGGVQVGYVYHVGGSVNLSTCAGSLGNNDNAPAFEDTSNPGSTPGAQLHGPALLTLDSAGNIYIADISNATVRVINTQATPQTFFQYTVQPGYMRSITNCNAALTAACPSGTTNLVNNGINGPVNAISFSSQYKEAEVDAYGNIYQLNGTGGGTGAPGIYGAAAYAGGAPLTNLLTAEAPSLASTYPGELPLTYGNSYVALDNPGITTTLPSSFPNVTATTTSTFDIRPNAFRPDNFGTFWFADTHYPELERVDQYTSLATLFLLSKRATANISPFNTSVATFSNPYYCVYGNTGSKIAWTQGPQSYDPQGDGCPAVVAYYAGGNSQTVSDGLADIFVGDPGENLERELVNGNVFPATPMGSTTTFQPIQVHFNSSNPPALGGTTIPDGPATGYTTTAFSIAPGISDFTIDTTDPVFPMGSLLGGGAYGNSTTTANFQMWSGLPTCTQLGQYPASTSITDYDCLVYVAFNPTAPGLRQSQLKVTTANGSVYYFSLSGIGTGGALAIDGGAPTTVPITGLGSSSTPTIGGIAVSQSGTLYVADPANNRIVVVPAGAGSQSDLTFTGVTPATLSGPMGVALDSAANIYVSDTGNNRILKINPLTGIATQLGNYVWIPGDASTAPPQYAFNAPEGIAVDQSNNVYVADTGNKAVVEIPSNLVLGGAVPLLDYPGAPQFGNPVGVAVDSQGNIYVADTQNPSIIVLPPGGGDLVNLGGSTFPNTISGPGFKTPSGVAVDAAGDVYVSDSGSNDVVEVPPTASAPFVVNFTTVNTADTALTTLNAPGALALDASGNLYVADTGNQQVLFDGRQSPMVNYGNVPMDQSPTDQPICATTDLSNGFNIGNTNGTCPVTVTNIGNAPAVLTSPLTAILGAGNPAFSIITSTCASPLPPGATCTIAPTMFDPSVDNSQSENISVNGTQTVSFVANGVSPLVDLVLSTSYSVGTTPTAGATATITATATQPHIVGNTPTGTVTFTYTIDAANKNVNSCGSGGTSTVPLDGSGVAAFQLPVLASGLQYTVTATYNGDAQNTATTAPTLLIAVPGSPVTVTVTSTAAQLTYTYGSAAPVPVGTVTPTLPTGVTASFGSGASATTPIGTYPVVVSFSGSGACAFGFPPADFAAGGAAFITESPEPLSYTLPDFTAQYGAADISYGKSAVIVGTVNGDNFTVTFVPAKSSNLDVGSYTVVPTLTGAAASNYAVTVNDGHLTVTLAPTSISVTQAKTTVAATTAGVASATFSFSVGTAVTAGKGIPTGTITVTDVFTQITDTGYDPPSAPATYTVPLTAGVGSYVPTDATPGIHQYSFAYSGDSDFQPSEIVLAANTAACTPSVLTDNCLVVDNADFFLTSNTGPVVVIPGVVPSGNGLIAAPNQSTAAPETAVLFVSTINSFAGTVNLSCTPDHPSYVSCFMTPLSVCFIKTASSACGNTATTAAAVVAVFTPATLPLGFKTSQVQTSTGKTVLAFLPFGFLAFCVRRRRRLSKALWMVIGIVAVGAVMTGCGGNLVNFYTPIPTGPQNVTVTATSIANGSGQPAATRTFVVPIEID